METERAAVHSALRATCKEYQLAKETVQENESICIDEGFYQRAVGIVWRSQLNESDFERYFEIVPRPDILIHVDATPKVCLDRQEARGRVVVDKSWGETRLKEQKKLHKICETVCSWAKRRGTTVIHVDNAGYLAEVSDELRDCLMNHIESQQTK